ncbi:MAG: glycosyltransferase family 39 protein [Nitrospinae bacterium]|nr:glycosyltransferase family 39 protein [Nitrospinota bacterium]
MNKKTLIYLILIIVFHLSFWFAISSNLTIHPDEADHWVWSQHLSWGYFEHPPMIAFVIRLFTNIFGDKWYAIELCSQSMSILTIIFLFILSKELFGAEAALVSVIITESMPLFFIGSTILTIDNIMIVFWIMTTYLFLKGLKEDKKGFLLLSGVTFGLGLMSKYTMILLPASIFLYLVVSPHHRVLLKRKEPYLSFLIGLIIFSPVIFWNAQNDWLSFKYQFTKGLTGGEKGGQLFFFIGSQFVILGPTMFPFFLYSLYKGFRDSWLKSSDPSTGWVPRNLQSSILYLSILASFPFFFFAFASFRSKYTDVGWSDVALIVGIVFMGKVFIDIYREMGIRKKIIISSALFMPGFLLSGFLAVHSIKPFPFIPKNVDKSLEMFGWDEIGAEAEKAFNKYLPDEKRRYIISKEYQMAGSLSFYAPSHPIPYSFNKSFRNIWMKVEDIGKGSALMVCAEKDGNECVESAGKIFNEVKEVERMDVRRRGEVVRSVKFYVCREIK